MLCDLNRAFHNIYILVFCTIDCAVYCFRILENNPDLEWKIFANMVSNTKAQKLSSEDLIAKHDYPFMQSCISRTAIVDNALSLYKPVAKHRVMSNVAQDFVDLVEELLED